MTDLTLIDGGKGTEPTPPTPLWPDPPQRSYEVLQQDLELAMRVLGLHTARLGLPGALDGFNSTLEEMACIAEKIDAINRPGAA